MKKGAVFLIATSIIILGAILYFIIGIKHIGISKADKEITCINSEFYKYDSEIGACIVVEGVS